MDSEKLSPRTAGLLGYAGLIPFVLAAGFAALLLWERGRCPVTSPPWYPGLRARLTLAVLACHAVALAGIMTSA